MVAKIYEADGAIIRKLPTESKAEDGSTHISIGFPVCRLTEWCEDQGEALAEIMNRGHAYEALCDALKPSAATKAAYIGEFTFSVPDNGYDEEGEPFEQDRDVTVPWTTVKEIMAAILAYAGQEGAA